MKQVILALIALVFFTGSAWAADAPERSSGEDQVQSETIKGETTQVVLFEIPFWAQEEGAGQKVDTATSSSCSCSITCGSISGCGHGICGGGSEACCDSCFTAACAICEARFGLE